MFRTSIVHRQERSYAVCCDLVRPVVMRVKEELLCSYSFTLITTGRLETYQIATYSIRMLLKMVYWSPKHVELLNVMNKINHQILCILLHYGYIAASSSRIQSLFMHIQYIGKIFVPAMETKSPYPCTYNGLFQHENFHKLCNMKFDAQNLPLRSILSEHHKDLH